MSINEKVAKIREWLCNGDNTLFAEKLGVSQQYASNICKEGKNVGEKQRQHILDTFPSINRSWFLADVGQPLNTPNNPYDQLTEEDMNEEQSIGFEYALAQAYSEGKIYPVKVHKKIVMEKDKRIEELQREVWELQKKLNELSK